MTKMAVFAFLVGLLSLVSVSHAVWKCSEAPALYKTQQIEAGLGSVLAVNYHKYAYFLNGKYWTNLYQYNTKYITTGPTGTWALNHKKGLSRLVGGNFTSVPGLALTQVDAGGSGFLVGSTGTRAYCLRTAYATRYTGRGRVYWTVLGSYAFKHFSCGPFGCWGVDTSGRVYHTPSITASTCKVSSWRYISAGMAMVDVSSEGMVFAISTSGEVFQRNGVHGGRTYGTSWTKIPMCMTMRHLSYDLGKLWVVSTSGLVMSCTH